MATRRRRQRQAGPEDPWYPVEMPMTEAERAFLAAYASRRKMLSRLLRSVLLGMVAILFFLGLTRSQPWPPDAESMFFVMLLVVFGIGGYIWWYYLGDGRRLREDRQETAFMRVIGPVTRCAPKRSGKTTYGYTLQVAREDVIVMDEFDRPFLDWGTWVPPVLAKLKWASVDYLKHSRTVLEIREGDRAVYRHSRYHPQRPTLSPEDSLKQGGPE